MLSSEPQISKTAQIASHSHPHTSPHPTTSSLSHPHHFPQPYISSDSPLHYISPSLRSPSSPITAKSLSVGLKIRRRSCVVTSSIIVFVTLLTYILVLTQNYHYSLTVNMKTSQLSSSTEAESVTVTQQRRVSHEQQHRPPPSPPHTIEALGENFKFPTTAASSSSRPTGQITRVIESTKMADAPRCLFPTYHVATHETSTASKAPHGDDTRHRRQPLKTRHLPTCKMPAILSKRRKLEVNGSLTRPEEKHLRISDDKEVLKTFPYTSDFFMPPRRLPSRTLKGDNSVGNSTTHQFPKAMTFVTYDEVLWRNELCKDEESLARDVIVPDQLVFFFAQDGGEWEMESVTDQIAPFLFTARRRNYHFVDDFKTRDEHLALLRDYDANTTVMTIHLTFDGRMKDYQYIAKSFVETIACVVEHMRLWYPQTIVDQLLNTARGTIMIGEFTQHPTNLHRLFTLMDWYRAGMAVFDQKTGLVTVATPMGENGTIVTTSAQYPPEPSTRDYNFTTDWPPKPFDSPKNRPFVLPEITTVYGTSDEYLYNEPIAYYSAIWRSLDPKRRSYLRQYAPKVMRDEASAGTSFIANNIEHVMSGFRNFGGSEVISYDASISKNVLKDRSYLWSFLGHLFDRPDRVLMNRTLTQWSLLNHTDKSFHCCGGGTHVRQLYLKSIFVPIGRGNANLDCFRIYEAAGSGAIPIIVSNNTQEIYHTFGYFATSLHRKPPFLFADSWEQATIEADRLLSNPQELQRRHEDVTRWFYKNFHYIQKKIFGF